MDIPKDPIMLMSFLNTQLRDNYSSLGELTKSYSISEKDILEKLSVAGYFYDEETNQIKRKV